MNSIPQEARRFHFSPQAIYNWIPLCFFLCEEVVKQGFQAKSIKPTSSLILFIT